MSIRIAHHREVTHDAAKVHRRFHKNVLFTRKFGNPIDFFAGLALKSEVIQARLYFVLYHDQDEHWILTGSRLRAEPNVVTAFRPAIANDGKAAKRSVKID